MFTIVVVAIGLVLACVAIHGYTLQTSARLLFHEKHFGFPRVGLLIVIAILAHLLEIVMFEVSYYWLVRDPDQGTIKGSDFPLMARDLFYFSAVTYTSLGYGDLVPTGNLRFMAIVEALTGLIMIAWTTSFTFLVMQKSLHPRQSRKDELADQARRAIASASTGPEGMQQPEPSD